MYVGVTRAEDSLYLTLARKRMILGRGPAGGSGFTSNYTVPSRFLREIAPGLLAGFYPPPAGERRAEIAQDDPFVSGGFGSAPAKSGGYQSGGNSYGNNYGGNSRPTNYGASGNSRSNNYGSGNNYDRAASSFGGNRSAGGSPQPPAKPRAMRVDPNAVPPAKTAHPNVVNAPVSFERLSVGDKVQHTKFGVGTVVQVIGDQDKELYNVEFDEAGRRLLDPRFAKLIKTT
jgi:DNA helicase-2/ATP-dependent DNA helicase PcrA